MKTIMRTAAIVSVAATSILMSGATAHATTQSPYAVLASEAGDTAVYLPTQYDRASRWPLVVLLHGAGATGEMQDLHLGIGDRVSKRGFVLAMPEAKIPGRGVTSAALLNLINDLKSQYSIDSSKVFLVGHSMGGYQSLRFACDHGDVISGMVISAAAGACPSGGNHPVRILLATGESDIDDASVRATMDSWIRSNRCGATSEVQRGYDLHWDIAGAESDLTAWSACESGKTVASLRSKFGRHIPVFRGEFANAALDFLLNGQVPPPPAARAACTAEGDDRGRYVSASLEATNQKTQLTVSEYADSACGSRLSSVSFVGPANQSTGATQRLNGAVYPLSFETVTVEAANQAVADDLRTAPALCGQAWQLGAAYTISGRDPAARQSCLTSVGGIYGAGTFAKKLLLSYMFYPAVP